MRRAPPADRHVRRRESTSNAGRVAKKIEQLAEDYARLCPDSGLAHHRRQSQHAPRRSPARSRSTSSGQPKPTAHFPPIGRSTEPAQCATVATRRAIRRSWRMPAGWALMWSGPTSLTCAWTPPVGCWRPICRSTSCSSMKWCWRTGRLASGGSSPTRPWGGCRTARSTSRPTRTSVLMTSPSIMPGEPNRSRRRRSHAYTCQKHPPHTAYANAHQSPTHPAAHQQRTEPSPNTHRPRPHYPRPTHRIVPNPPKSRCPRRYPNQDATAAAQPPPTAAVAAAVRRNAYR